MQWSVTSRLKACNVLSHQDLSAHKDQLCVRTLWCDISRNKKTYVCICKWNVAKVYLYKTLN